MRGRCGGSILFGVLMVCPGLVLAGESPKAERPVYAVGEEWFRSDGVYELVRVEGERYVFAAGPDREVHLTKDLAPARVQRGSNLMEFDPPPQITWPLEVGKWGSSFGTWRNPRLPGGFRVNFTWSVDAYEEVRVPAGAFQAFQVRLTARWGSAAGRAQQEYQIRWWYAPVARQFVKVASERPGMLDFELVHVDRSSFRPAPSPVATRYGVEFLDALEAVQRGEGREALRYYEWLAEKRERTGPPLEAAKAHGAITAVAGRLGMHQRTIKAGLRALDLLRTLPPSEETLRHQLNVYAHVAVNYAVARDLKEARRYSEEGLALARTSTNPQRTAFFSGAFASGLAMAATAEGDNAAAVRYGDEAVRALDQYLQQLPAGARFDRARSNGGRVLGLALARLGQGHRHLGNLAEARAAGQRGVVVAKASGHPEAEAAALLLLGRIAQAARDYPASLALFQEAEAAASRANLAGYLMWVLDGMGATHARQGQYAEALAAYRRAVVEVEDVRSHFQDVGLRSGFVEDKQQIYYGAVASALQVGRPDEAFAYAERARARAFLDLLGGQTVLSKGRTRTLVAEEARLRAALAAAQAMAEGTAEEEAPDPAQGRGRLQAAQQAYRAFLERVRRENVEQASLMTVEPVTLQEVQGLLPEGTTLLEYLVTGSETIVWVIDRQRAEVFRIPGSRRDLVAQVRAFREAIARVAPLPEVQSHARVLYDRLLGPVRSRIRSDRLLVVPHDVLHYLPFAALRMPEGRWVLEDYAVATLPSASVLKYLSGKGQGANAGALAVGNPDVGPGLALRYAEREARAVGQHFPGAVVLVRQDATEAQTKRLVEQAAILHFATHGELNEKDPLSSALLLVPEGSEDGRLEVREIFGLDIKARLVVLSACETGLGQLSKGDELVGLQRAFLYAGTPAVMTTLWKVDDRASYRLMEAFYANLDLAGPAAALRAAQRETMRTFPHPFAWAAFGLTGVPR